MHRLRVGGTAIRMDGDHEDTRSHYQTNSGAPPAGFPDGMPAENSHLGTKIMGYHRWGGDPTLTDGSIIEVRFDHDAGTLSFGVNGEPPRHALGGFPKAVAMRPWVELGFPARQLSLVRPYL